MKPSSRLKIITTQQRKTALLSLKERKIAKKTAKKIVKTV